jgi:hypothetical protein
MKPRKAHLISSYLILFVFAIFSYPASAEKTLYENGELLVSKEKDVTGDGIPDKIAISGIPYDAKSQFQKKMFITVNSPPDFLKVPLEGGYNPSLFFADFNGDHVCDVFAQADTGGSGGTVKGYTFSFKGGRVKESSVPPPVSAGGEFLDGYLAKITLKNHKPVIMDVSSRKQEYERLGIYQKGRLNEPAELLIDTYSSLKIIKVSGNKKGIRGIQRISGAYHADALAEVISDWGYTNGKWQMISAEIRKI